MLSEILMLIYVVMAPLFVCMADVTLLIGYGMKEYTWYQLPWDIMTVVLMLLAVITQIVFLIARTYCCQVLGYSKTKWRWIVEISSGVILVPAMAMFVPCLILIRDNIDASNPCFSLMGARAMTALVIVFTSGRTLTLAINDLDIDKVEKQHVAGPMAKKDSPTSTPAKVPDTDTLRCLE
jgi:hypothetical protein